MSEKVNRRDNCLVCGAGEFVELYPVRDTNQDAPGEWMIIACKKCGMARLDPMPSPEEIEGFYIDTFYTEEGARFRSWVERLRGRLALRRGRTLGKLAPNKGKLLDFGSGAGHFGQAQKSIGWDVYEVDPFSKREKQSLRCKIEGDRIILDCEDSSFDAVTLWYVIEHLRDPRAAIRESYRILRPGGVLMLAQQNFASAQARLFKDKWLFLDPPRHLYHFTPENLRDLAEQEGLKQVAINHASIEMGPFTILQSALNMMVGNENYLFKFLKDKKLAMRQKGARLPLAISLVLAAPLGALSLLAYWGLLLFNSGDVFELYLKKPDQPGSKDSHIVADQADGSSS